MTAIRSPRRGRLLLVLAAALAGAPVATSARAEARDAHQFGAPIFSADARGDIVTIGNVTTTCDPTYENEHWSAAESRAACDGARSGATDLVRHDGAPMPPINNRLSMRFVDVDDRAATFSSSRSRLHLPEGAKVLWAGLHWNAATAVPEAAALYGSTDTSPPPNAAARFDVLVTAPGASEPTPISADDRWDDTNPGGTTSYGGYAEVTDLVRAAGSGTYTAANVQSCQGFGGCFGSWSLTVAFAHPDEPPRNLNVWHGWKLTTPTVDGGVQEFTVSGIEPPVRGPVQARIGVVQADGDRGLGPDSLEIASPSQPSWKVFSTVDRPLAPGEEDWFNSTVNAYGMRRADADASPNLLANLNQDIALVEDATVIGNEDRSFSFRVRTGGTESLYSQVVHASVALHAPTIALDKTVEPGGPVPPGTEVSWTLRVRNIGMDPIRTALIRDPLPDGLRFVPGSVRYLDGGPAELLGPMTDAVGDDQADWDPATRTLTLRVGAGATSTAGGVMGVAPAPDGSQELVISYRTVVDEHTGQPVVNEAIATGEGRDLSDGFGPLHTEDPGDASIATVPEADLGITKTDDDATVRAVGDRFWYRFEVTNAGPSPATGVTVTDELDHRLRFVGSPDGCSADGAVVTCPIGSLAVGEQVSRAIEVEVLELPGAGRSIPNLAVVRGDQPDPDCDPAHPDAACNADDEETPQLAPPTTTTTALAPTSTTAVPAPPTTAPPTTSPPAPPRPDPTPTALARTGGSHLRWAAFGTTLVAGGAALLLGRRRSGAAARSS